MGKNNSTLSRNSVQYDSFDKAAYEEILRQSKELQSLSAQGTQTLNTFAEIAEDVFFALYKVKPELTPPNELSTEYLLNYELISKLMESQSYQELREYTQLDELGAGLGSKALLENLLKQMEQDGDLKEVSNKINDTLKNKAGIPSDEVHHRVSSLQSKLRQVVELATDKAVTEVEEVEQVITSWGLNQGEFTRLPYEKKLELLHVLRSQQKFKDMSNLVGRMRKLASVSRKAKLEHRVELHSITQGTDINHVLPQELLALRKPLLKLDFYRRMMEKQLLQYDLNQKEYVGQGPIIALIDTSSSMVGNREHWSKAVALGLAEIAEKERRGFSYALFASRAALITDDFQIGQRSPDKVIKLASEFIGGGTNFEQPLQWALDKLRESTFSKADIVMITDGECAVSNEFLTELQKVKEQKECRIYSILIGSNPKELSRWSDAVWSITDLLDETTVQELFQKI
ncbi:hypothetical protein SOV_10490 [Sporomusa ovata DSM 2662]|uniref:VWFA domain-containing protein n=1 Tax=Sporomusa ovata TaxID=2378 RepID=A0A0U1KXQ2_9FIRM|nr:VWA domain-containing protein [Sporomusa ovata]EQB28698.1 uncharacterized protein containing a von willebrand factor type A [Sporomusa ovata DSM 2662]CQR72208.1 hypothetical protein SpAn4DRAFT_5097 [Sporomusa ovata]